MQSFFSVLSFLLLLPSPPPASADASAEAAAEAAASSAEKSGRTAAPTEAAERKPASETATSTAKQKTIRFSTKKTDFRKTAAATAQKPQERGPERKPKRATAAALKPLVVQWEVSHPRNTDQISLIFRQKTAELVTNTSLGPKNRLKNTETATEKPPRLGRFGAVMTRELHRMRREAAHCHDRLRNTVPILSLIKDLRLKAPPREPHAAVLRVGGEQAHEKDPCFEILSQILKDARQIIRVCIECAYYKRKGDSIERTAQGGLFGAVGPINRTDSGERGEVKLFSEKELDCLPKGGGKAECIDPHFGIFKI